MSHRCPQSLNILHVLPSLATAGGVEKVVIDTVVGFSKKNFGQHHLACEAGALLFELRNKAENAKHHAIALTTKNPIRIFINAWKLYKVIETNNITLVHAHSRGPAWSTLLACSFCKIPFVTTFHGAHKVGSTLKRWYNSVMIRSDLTIVISDYMLQYIKRYYPAAQKCAFIAQGIDTDYFNPSAISEERLNQAKKLLFIEDFKPYRKVILVPARLTPIKGHRVILEAVKRFENLQNIHLVFLGDDQGRCAYRQELGQMAQGLPVFFVPHTNDMPAVFAVSDIVLSCAIHPESFGRVVAEALAMEKNIIATQHGGSIELTKNGKFATLVPPGDVISLWKALDILLTKPLKPNREGRFFIIQSFSIHAMLDKIKSSYLRLTKKEF